MTAGATAPEAGLGRVPVIDVGELVRGTGDGGRRAAREIGGACRESGFFYVAGHGVDGELLTRLDRVARQFFARPVDDKMRLRMELGGRAWRGYFPLGGELTSGKPDAKEGLYFGAELGEDDPRVRAGVPLHGRNLFPSDLPGFRETVLSYLDALTGLGHAIMRGIALSLGLEASYFRDRYMTDPLILFRIFRYPPVPQREGEPQWGVGEHTDYGMLTILMQDDVGGLQVKTPRGWIDAPPVPGSFVCNIGDMLDRMTRGLYRSTPHRVVNVSGRERFSFPFFFDPGWDARVGPIELPGPIPQDDREERWDRASVHAFQGTYGDYILGKVAKVFPNLSGAR